MRAVAINASMAPPFIKTTVKEEEPVDVKAPRLLVRPDNRINNVESKVDKLADQLAELSLVVKKAHSEDKGNKRGEDLICSYCQKPGHTASRCPINPNRNKRCNNCGKMGHTEDTCWAKKKKNTQFKDDQAKGKEKETVSVVFEEEVERSAEGSVESDSEDSSGLLSPEENVSVLLDTEGPLRGEEGVGSDEEQAEVLSVKRNASGEPFQKAAREHDVGIGNLLNPMAATRNPTPPGNSAQHATQKKREIIDLTKKKAVKKPKATKKKAGSRRKQAGGSSNKQTIKDYAGKYDLLTELANAPCGLTFGQLLRGDAVEAKKQLERLLSLRGSKVTVVEDGPLQSKKRTLQLTMIGVYGKEVLALIDSGAGPNFLSLDLVNRLGIRSEPTERSITTATGQKKSAAGVVRKVPTSFEDLIIDLDYIVVEGSPYDVLIGQPAMESLRGVLDFGNRMLNINHNG